jgi:hypothetical protein
MLVDTGPKDIATTLSSNRVNVQAAYLPDGELVAAGPLLRHLESLSKWSQVDVGILRSLLLRCHPRSCFFSFGRKRQTRLSWCMQGRWVETPVLANASKAVYRKIRSMCWPERIKLNVLLVPAGLES